MPNMVRFHYHSYRRKPAIVADARTSRGVVKTPNKPVVMKGQEGSVSVSTLISIPMGATGFMAGAYLQFHILGETIAKGRGDIPFNELNFIEVISHPAFTKNYLSMIAMGAIGAVVGVGIAKFPAMLNQNGDK